LRNIISRRAKVTHASGGDVLSDEIGAVLDVLADVVELEEDDADKLGFMSASTTA
jgi:hypothetical protein